MAEKNPVGMRLAREEFAKTSPNALTKRAYEGAGRDIRRAEFSEAAEKRQYRKASDMAKAAGIDPEKDPKAFRKYVRKALRALDRPVGLIPVGKSKSGETIFALPNLPPIEFSRLYTRTPPRRDEVQPSPEDPAVVALVEAKVGAPAKRRLSFRARGDKEDPEEYKAEYRAYLRNLKSELDAAAEPVVVTDSSGRVVVMGAVAKRAFDEAQKAVGDARFKLSREQWEAARKIIQQDPVFIEITDPNDPLFVKRTDAPKRSDFAFTDAGRKEFESALAKWAGTERSERRQSQFYVCKRCTHSVRTGHACKCTLDTKLKLPKIRQFKRWQAPKRRKSESEKSYEIRYDTALAKYNLQKAAFDQQQRTSLQRQLMKLPAERRLYQSIAVKIRERMGARPTDPAAQIDYDARVAELAGAELAREISSRIEATQAEARLAPSEKAPFVGTMRGPAFLRSLEKVAAPGTVTVQASSKAEAEGKATTIAAKEIDPKLFDAIKSEAREAAERAAEKFPSISDEPVSSKSQLERRVERLLAEKEKKGTLSQAKYMELKRLQSALAAEVQSATIREKKQLSGFSDDAGGSIVGLAVGGLVAFALFKALTEKGVKS